MRILYDHQVFSLQNAGGASRYHYELAQYLGTQADVHTTLLVGWNQSVHPLTKLAGPHLRVVSHWTSLGPGVPRYLLNEAMGNAAALAGGKVDIYHPTLYRRMPMVRARSVVVTHHDCVHERFPEFFPDVKKVLRAKARLYAEADGIVCVSESSRQDLLRFYPVDKAKTRVVHHGLAPLPKTGLPDSGLAEKIRRDFVLAVGMRPPYKNFNRLLEAFAASGLSGSLDLLVLGGGRLTDEERRLAEKLGVAQAVVAVPQASEALLAEAYTRARLFVYPSLCEGFGFPPLEAMGAGCPVAASRAPSLPEVCGEAPLYFDPEDVEAMRQALVRGVNDAVWREEAAFRGREVAAQYSWQRCGEQTLEFYRNCL